MGQGARRPVEGSVVARLEGSVVHDRNAGTGRASKSLRPQARGRAALMLLVFVCLASGRAQPAEGPSPETVRFEGPGDVQLVGYLFRPEGRGGRVPAIVMMHGRAGPYSSRAAGRYDATTLSRRHMAWGSAWARHGIAALLVDGFGPRGDPAGFPIHSYDERPEAVNEVTVRPRDAYAALAYLRQRPDIDPDRIGLQGWSNGGSATLATMATRTLGTAGLGPRQGFRGAIAFYPACGLHGAFEDGYAVYAPVRVFSGDADEEVSAQRCARLVEAGRAGGSDIAITIYSGATHDFDDPGRKRQDVPANAAANAAATAAALAFMEDLLGR